MTEEERLALFRAAQARTQQAYDNEIAANATPRYKIPLESDESEYDPEYEQEDGSFRAGVEPDRFQTDEPPLYEEMAPMPEMAMEPVNLTSPNMPPATFAPPTSPAYNGEAFPGLPVIEEGGQTYYGGERMVSEEAAMQARARHAAASPQVQQQMAQQQRAQNTSSIDIQQEIARLTPSRAERMRQVQMENGVARLDQARREGRINQQQFDQMNRQLQIQMRPAQQSAQQLIAARRAAEVALLEERTALLSRQRTNAEDFDNATQRQPNIWTDPASGQRFLRTREGWTQTRAETRPTPERPVITGESIGQSVQPRRGSGSSTSGSGESGPATPPTRSDMEAAARSQVEAADVASQAQEDLERLRPRGRLPFTRVPAAQRQFNPNPPQGSRNLTWSEEGQQLINDAAERFDLADDPDNSRAIRAIGGALRNGQTTGQLTSEQQQMLRDAGYYRGDFTPALDRELARIENPPEERVGTLESGSRVSVRPVVSQAVRDATRTIRNLLGRHQTRDALMRNPKAFAQFNGALAAIRVFNWGRSEEEQREGRRAPADPPARQSPPRRQGTDPLGQQLSQQSQYRS